MIVVNVNTGRVSDTMTSSFSTDIDKIRRFSDSFDQHWKRRINVNKVGKQP